MNQFRLVNDQNGMKVFQNVDTDSILMIREGKCSKCGSEVNDKFWEDSSLVGECSGCFKLSYDSE